MPSLKQVFNISNYTSNNNLSISWWEKWNCASVSSKISYEKQSNLLKWQFCHDKVFMWWEGMILFEHFSSFSNPSSLSLSSWLFTYRKKISTVFAMLGGNFFYYLSFFLFYFSWCFFFFPIACCIIYQIAPGMSVHNMELHLWKQEVLNFLWRQQDWTGI